MGAERESMSGQLGDDRSERISDVGADDNVGEAALLPSTGSSSSPAEARVHVLRHQSACETFEEGLNVRRKQLGCLMSGPVAAAVIDIPGHEVVVIPFDEPPDRPGVIGELR